MASRGLAAGVALSLAAGIGGGLVDHYAIGNSPEGGKAPDQIARIAKDVVGPQCMHQVEVDFNHNYPPVTLKAGVAYSAEQYKNAFDAETKREGAEASFKAGDLKTCVNTNLTNPARKYGQEILNAATSTTTMPATTTTKG